mmetsp:Transcript_34367/g.107764  ORF Transcript_34367/g.107764 Transcript_34367/m.107764 type:complete len:112 (-) Transcript_34367:138-473(-)
MSGWKGFRAIKVVANAFSPAAQLKQASVKENVADEFQPDAHVVPSHRLYRELQKEVVAGSKHASIPMILNEWVRNNDKESIEVMFHALGLLFVREDHLVIIQQFLQLQAEG